MHGVRGVSGDFPARGPGVFPDLCPRARPSPPVFTLRKYSCLCPTQAVGGVGPYPGGVGFRAPLPSTAGSPGGGGMGGEHCYFPRNLERGAYGGDVYCLQQHLKAGVRARPGPAARPPARRPMSSKAPRGRPHHSRSAWPWRNCLPRPDPRPVARGGAPAPVRRPPSHVRETGSQVRRRRPGVLTREGRVGGAGRRGTSGWTRRGSSATRRSGRWRPGRRPRRPRRGRSSGTGSAGRSTPGGAASPCPGSSTGIRGGRTGRARPASTCARSSTGPRTARRAASSTRGIGRTPARRPARSRSAPRATGRFPARARGGRRATSSA